MKRQNMAHPLSAAKVTECRRFGFAFRSFTSKTGGCRTENAVFYLEFSQILPIGVEIVVYIHTPKICVIMGIIFFGDFGYKFCPTSRSRFAEDRNFGAVGVYTRNYNYASAEKSLLHIDTRKGKSTAYRKA